MRHYMNRSVLFLIGIVCVGSMAFTTLAQAETLSSSSLFHRIIVAFSVDQKAAQAWLPAPWKVVSTPRGPFKGTNLLILFDDRFIMQDAEGKPFLGGGESFCLVALASLGKNEKSGEIRMFVTRVYWSYDDPSVFKNAVKATVSREATIKASISGAGSEAWKVRGGAGGILEFRMDYQRGIPSRTKREHKAYSSVDPNILVLFRDDYAGDVVKSIPAGIDKVKNYEFKVTKSSELGEMFDGSEQLVGIAVNLSRVRQKFLP